MRGQLFYEERVAVLRAMLNEDSIPVFGPMTRAQRAFIWRLIAIADGDRLSVPRRHIRHTRKIRRAP